jgi:hypothetical protein
MPLAAIVYEFAMLLHSLLNCTALYPYKYMYHYCYNTAYYYHTIAAPLLTLLVCVAHTTALTRSVFTVLQYALLTPLHVHLLYVLCCM